MSNMLLHCGAERLSLAELRNVPTPERTDTYTPIPYDRIVDLTADSLSDNGLKLKDTEFATNREGKQFFGLLTVEKTGRHAGSNSFEWFIGMRSSHDRSIAVNEVAGGGVTVCDNMLFSGAIFLRGIHTGNLDIKLPELVNELVVEVLPNFISLEERAEAYREAPIKNRLVVHDMMIEMMNRKAITTTEIPKVLDAWREPKHEEFKPRNAWSLLNAFTEVQKRKSMMTLPGRTLKVQHFLDEYAGITQSTGG